MNKQAANIKQCRSGSVSGNRRECNIKISTKSEMTNLMTFADHERSLTRIKIAYSSACSIVTFYCSVTNMLTAETHHTHFIELVAVRKNCLVYAAHIELIAGRSKII